MTVTHRCARCQRQLPVSAFRFNARLKSGLHSWCRECCVTRNRQWRADNVDKVARYNADRRSGIREVGIPTHCVVCGAAIVKYAVTREPVCRRSSCRDTRCDSGGLAARNLRRRMKRRRGGPRPSTAELRALKRATRSCSLCGCRLTDALGPRKGVVDHIVPLAAGGSNHITNLRMICHDCNSHRPHDASDVVQEGLFSRCA
jgi:hypothetical protein